MVCRLIFLLLITNIAFAQRIDSVSTQLAKVDSVKKVAVDSAQKFAFLKKFFKADSAKKANPARKALIRSLILPGWGQATNKEYWVIPIVYAAAAGGVYAYWYTNDNYWYYKRYLKKLVYDSSLKSIEIEDRSGPFNRKTGVKLGPFTKAQIEPAVNSFRRYRDLTTIIFAVGWTLQAIQANVSAHLRTFDMSDDISLKLEPGIQSSPFGSAVGARIVLNFK